MKKGILAFLWILIIFFSYKIYDSINGPIVFNEVKNERYTKVINRLKIISNFSGSSGLAIILKNKNYLFTDGRYTIQSQLESGKNFKIFGFEKLIMSKNALEMLESRIN